MVKNQDNNNYQYDLETWWSDGLNFTCIPECGRCCNEPDGLVFLSTIDAENLSRHFGMSVDDWIERDCTRYRDGRIVLKSRESDGICIYLSENMSCEVYDEKPTQCSAFPWWKENLKNERSWEKTKQICPGIDDKDALRISANVIYEWINRDIESTRGFRRYTKSKKE